MSKQQWDEYQMLEKEYDKEDSELHIRNQKFLGGSDLTGNRFQDPNAKPKEKIVFDDDFKNIFFAEKDYRENVMENMTEEKYIEYSDMSHEYIKTDYAERVVDQYQYEGDKLIENRFLVQKEPNEFEKELERYRLINEPPPEQSITLRRRGPKLKGDDEGTEAQVKARLKERERQAFKKLSSPPSMGAAKGTKSPLLKRIRDLE